jgi:hypothetical protein
LTAPWELYYASRTRRILAAAAKDDVDPDLARRQRRAATELKLHELFSLSLTVLSPFIGAYLLYGMRGALSEPDRYINPFSIRLFVLGSGVKPWMHFFRLVRNRSLFLQETVHYPSTEVQLLRRKVLRLEAQMKRLSREFATTKDEFDDVMRRQEGIERPVGQLSRAVRRHAQKEEVHRLSTDERFSVLDERTAELAAELAMNAELIDQLRAQASHSRILDTMLAVFHHLVRRPQFEVEGEEGERWYERGPLFYLFLPLNLTNRALDGVGHVATRIEGRTYGLLTASSAPVNEQLRGGRHDVRTRERLQSKADASDDSHDTSTITKQKP